MSEGKGQVTRVAKPHQTDPSSGKTVTVTITLPVRSGERFMESSADFINEVARDLARRLEAYVDPYRVTVAASYDYPQWRRVYEPDVSS
jgi:hypothetical protein